VRSTCDVVGVYRDEFEESERLTSAAVWCLNESQDEIMKPPERDRSCSFGKRRLERRSETSTPFKAIDSILLSRRWGSSGTNEETMVVKSCMSPLLR
jgi:hypothetical protein